MAGYMKKLNGHVYEGSYKASVALENGMFAELNDGTVRKTSATKDTIMRVSAKTTLWGVNAVVLDVTSVGADEIFLVENEWDVAEGQDYNTATYACKVGDYVKMHRPTIGEQLILTVGSALYAGLAVGDSVKPTTDGTIVKYTV